MKQAAAPQPRLSFVVSASHNAVIQAVYTFQLLTSAQLVRALGYSPHSLARVQRLTKQLVDNGYLLSLPVPVVRGKAPLVYTLARKGLNYLKAAGFAVREYFRPAQEHEKSYLFLQHTLSLNDVLIAATTLARFTSDYSLSSLTHERLLKRTPFKISIWRGERQEVVTVIPDAFLVFVEHLQNGRQRNIPLLLELDRNTTEQQHFRRNLRARIEFIKQEGYKTHLGMNTVTFAYAIALGGMKRREELRSWARKECATTSEQRWLSNLFLFADLPTELAPHKLFLTPSWFTPFGESPRSLLAG